MYMGMRAWITCRPMYVRIDAIISRTVVNAYLLSNNMYVCIFM